MKVQPADYDFELTAGRVFAQRGFRFLLPGSKALPVEYGAQALTDGAQLLIRGRRVEIEQRVDRQAECAGERRQQRDIWVACARFP